jgi:6,7-dimethyl-8-ribityllumazine synthase
MAVTTPAREPERAADARVLIVAARYAPAQRAIVDALVEAAEAAVKAGGGESEIIDVPGALEIPGAIATAATAGEHGRIPAYDGYVALGCVLRGETTHYDTVCTESARGIMDLTVQRGLAIGNGVLTVETMAQAEARAQRRGVNKGAEAAIAAMAMIGLKRRLAGAQR